MQISGGYRYPSNWILFFLSLVTFTVTTRVPHKTFLRRLFLCAAYLTSGFEEMKMRYTLAFIIISLCASPSLAVEGLIGVYGMGELSCGKYISQISTNPGAANAYSWWIAGFITGTNLEKERVVSTDMPAHEIWLKQYCEKNPLDTFVQAAIELNGELDRRRLR